MNFILQSPPPLNFSLCPKYPWLSPPQLLAPFKCFCCNSAKEEDYIAEDGLVY